MTSKVLKSLGRDMHSHERLLVYFLFWSHVLD